MHVAWEDSRLATGTTAGGVGGPGTTTEEDTLA